MTISNTNSAKHHNSARTKDSSSNTDQKISNLIETFTANLDTSNLSNSNSGSSDTFRVNGQVGTFIAQKLSNGEKIRVGRNGQVISTMNYVEEKQQTRRYVFFIFTSTEISLL